MQSAFNFYEETVARPERPERLFFCIFPDVETAIRIGRFGDRFLGERDLKGTRLSPDRLHVSLHHIGDYKRLRTPLLFAARQAGCAVSLPPFEMEFGFIRSFEGVGPPGDGMRRKPLVLLGAGKAATKLYEGLGAALAQHGLRAGKHFAPHMTLLYGAQPIPMQSIEPVRFAVRDFALVHSALGLTQHNLIERWPLARQG